MKIYQLCNNCNKKTHHENSICRVCDAFNLSVENAIERAEEHLRATIAPSTFSTQGCITVSPSGKVINGSQAANEISGSRVIHYKYRNNEFRWEL